jgi:hypothetical protein
LLIGPLFVLISFDIRNQEHAALDVVEVERIRCMENILSHYIPNISFDVQSLQKIEGDLERKRRDSGGDGPPTEIGLDELEDLAIDDEDFSIRELPDNTARMCFPLRFNRVSILRCGCDGCAIGC